MPTQIKICGLRDRDSIEVAARCGADYVGFVHYSKSPRHVTLDEAANLRRAVPSGVRSVLLLVNAEPNVTERAILSVQPDIVQFHGDETPEWLAMVKHHMGVEVWKAIGVRDAQALANSARFYASADRLIFDAPARALPGGNGHAIDWSLFDGYTSPLPWGLAGGLTPVNVAEALRATQAGLVDVSSGVESAPGIKDAARIIQFCEAVHAQQVSAA